MNIALIIKDLRRGGAERVVSRLSVILSEAGHDIYIILFSDASIDYDYAGKVVVLDSKIRKSIIGKIFTNLKRAKDLRNIKEKYKFDVAISFLDSPNILNIITRHKEKVIVSVRNFKSIEDKGIYRIINKALIKVLYPKSDNVVVVSKVLQDDMKRNYRIPDKKLVTIYNPYDIKQITEMSKQDLPLEYRKFYQDHKVIVTMGRLTKQKAYWNLVKAFAYLKEVHNDIGIVFLGDGEQETQLRDLAKSLGVDNSIVFAGYQKNPFMFIGKATTYVMTSLFEGFPNALVEAMACGVPVVSVDCKSGPREILYKHADLKYCASDIEYADYGILCPVFTEEDDWNTDVFSDNQKTLANAINVLLNDSDRWNYFSEKAIERAKDFSYERCLGSYLELFSQKDTNG